MRTAAVCLVVFVAACSDESPSSPVAPTNPMAHTTSGFTLSGTVRDSRPNGPALASATVRLDTGQSTAAGSDGRYRFQNVSGAVAVTASGPHHVAASETATMDQDRTVDFALAHTGVPPFEGTSFLSPRLIDSSDSTSLMNVTYAGRGMREVFDSCPAGSTGCPHSERLRALATVSDSTGSLLK